jgi:alcohol dehydrogenase
LSPITQPFAEIGDMKAIVFHQHGPLENIRYQDYPEPEVGGADCLVAVRALSLNGFDPMVLRGIPGLRTPLPMIPGADIVGEVLAVGAAVTRWKVGDRVAVIPSRPRVGMMGETLRGGACERIAVPEEFLLKLPDQVGYVEAACLPTAYGAAIRMMYTRGKVAAGEKVLILGASGGVGTCCVQLAKLAGAEVVAVTSADDKAAKLKEIGADHVFNATTQDYVQEVIKLYGKPRTWGGPGGVDVIVNYTGGDTWAQCFRVLTHQGRLLTCGATAGYDPKTDIRYIWSFEFNIIGSNSWTTEDHVTLLDMIAAGRLKPIIHSVRPLQELAISLQELIDRKVFGKAVLTL